MEPAGGAALSPLVGVVISLQHQHPILVLPQCDLVLDVDEFLRRLDRMSKTFFFFW